jgi:4'-phosphopantetheinyl transferase
LSPRERDVARRFHFAKHRLAYVFAHGVLRDILSRYLGCRPEEIQFDQDSFGKPFLTEGCDPIPPAFNLSHSGDLVAVALSRGRQIGIDVEEIRPIKDLERIAGSNFTPEECAFVLRHAAKAREHAFFRCWTRKEAYIKAVGKGLSIPLNTFDTLIGPRQPGRWLPRTVDAPGAANWWLADLDMPANYRGAVTVEGGFCRLTYSDWSPRSTTHRSSE